MTRHPSLHGQPDLDWERYEAELRTPARCGQALAVAVGVGFWALVVWAVRR